MPARFQTHRRRARESFIHAICWGVLALSLLAAPAARAQCDEGPFECARVAAVEAARDHLRRLEDGSGLADGQSHPANGLVALAFLEDAFDAGAGLDGLAPADRALVQRLLVAGINRDPLLLGAGGQLQIIPLATLMGALSLWRSMDGPEDIGAAVTVSAAIDRGAGLLIQFQSRPPDLPGGWSAHVNRPISPVATFFAARWLGAAGGGPAVLHTRAAAGAYTVANRTEDHGQAGEGGAASTAATAAAVWLGWTLRRSPRHPEVQHGMRWLWRHPWLAGLQGPHAEARAPFTRWVMAQGAWPYRLDAEGIYEDDLVWRDPAALGYPEELPSVWFDAVFDLIAEQDPVSGTWPEPIEDDPDGLSAVARHALSLRALRRRPYTGCVAFDDDPGGCGIEDNCPDVVNPGQEDADGDGWGDVCDNCPAVANRSQADTDGDGIGDACQGDLPDEMPDASVDAMPDAMADASVDAIPNAMPDAMPDATAAMPDAGPPVCAPPDAGTVCACEPGPDGGGSGAEVFREPCESCVVSGAPRGGSSTGWLWLLLGLGLVRRRR